MEKIDFSRYSFEKRLSLIDESKFLYLKKNKKQKKHAVWCQFSENISLALFLAGSYYFVKFPACVLINFSM